MAAGQTFGHRAWARPANGFTMSWTAAYNRCAARLVLDKAPLLTTTGAISFHESTSAAGRIRRSRCLTIACACCRLTAERAACLWPFSKPSNGSHTAG